MYFFMEVAEETRNKDDVISGKDSGEKNTLTLVLCLTAGFMLVEVAAGLYTGSLALLSDAAHMFVDVFAVSLALFALWFSLKPPTSKKTFGFYRAEILAAFLNSLLLFAISVGIFMEAYERLREPSDVKSLVMTVVAAIGLCVNLVGVFLLSKFQGKSLNARGVFFHVISDALGSVGAIIAGLIMLKTKWYYADPITSIVIAFLILRGAWGLFSESLHILLEGTPRGIDLKAVENAICSHSGVLSVHDLHAWSLTQGFEALSAHLVIEDIKQSESLIKDIKSHLHDKFRINHVTLQLETGKCETGEKNCYEA